MNKTHKNGHFPTQIGLTAEVVLKYLPESIMTKKDTQGRKGRMYAPPRSMHASPPKQKISHQKQEYISPKTADIMEYIIDEQEVSENTY